MVKIYSAAFRMLLLMIFGCDITKAYNNHSKIYALFFITLSIWTSAQAPSLEFTTGDGNPTATNGPVQNTSIRFRYNNDNPNGNTFQTYTPAITATFQLINQQYTLSTMSSNRPVNIGHNNVDGATPILRLLNSYGAPLSSWYTSNGATIGTGIDVTNNHGIMLGLLTSPLRAVGAATSGTQYWMADLVVSFSQAVNDPILHLAGVGSSTDGTVTPSIGFSTEFDIVSSNTAVTLTKLSGTNALGITGTKINNTGAIMSSTGTDNSVSGSVRINGTGITTLTLRIYMRGDGRTTASTSWADTNTSIVTGDALTLGFSLASPSSSCITSEPGSTPRNLCQNVPPTPLSVTATGATSYQWYYSSAADGGTITTVTGATSASYTPPTNATFATRYYFVTVETSCGTASTYPRTPVTVSANPTFTSNPAASTQTVCLNGTPANLTVATAATNTYQWYSNTANSNTGGTAISGATSATFTPPTNIAGTTYYYAVITNTTTTCTATSNVRGVIVLPELTITTQPDSTAQNLCVGSNATTLTVTATGATSYQWYYSTTPTGTGTSLGATATSASYTPITTTAFTTRYYYIIASNGTCTITSSPRTPVTVTANPTFTNNPAASTQTVCLNGTSTALTVAAAAGNTYQWYSNSTNSNTGGTAISGATLGTFTPPTNVAGATYYYAVITNTTSGCTAASNVRGVIVLPELAITTQPDSTAQNLCVGSNATTLAVTANGATSYQWFYSNAATGGTLTTVTGATAASYTIPTTATFATRYYYVTVSNGTCSVTSSQRTPVTVNANPTFTTNLTTGTQTVCINGTVTTLTVAAAAGNFYQWYSNTTNSNTGGTAISGATTGSYTPPSTTTGITYYYYAVITNTVTGCSTASNVRGVTILPELAITTQPDSTPQSLCVNGPGATLTVTANGATSYQWFYSNAATGGTLTTVTGATAASYTIPTTAAFATRYYYVTVSNGTCSVTSSQRTPVTVNSNPTFTLNPAASSQTVCQNAATTSLTVAGTGVTYQWYSNTTNSNTGGTLIAGATSGTYTPSSATGGTTYYYAVITSITTGCSTASNVRSVVVNGIIVQNLSTQTVCQNNPTSTLGIITSPAATAYQWYYNTTNTNVGGTIITGATSNSYIPPSNTLGTLYYFAQITTAGCTVRSSTAQVNIVNTGCPNLPIGCNPNLYLSQNSNTQLYLMDKSTNPFTYPPIGAASVLQYNGIAINPIDGEMYGIKDLSRTLIRINNNGSISQLGDIAGMPASSTISYNTGEIDDLGNFYVTPTGVGVTTMYKINIPTRTATTITLSQGLQISDLAYNVNDGNLYAVNIDGRSVRINTSTGVVTFINSATGSIVFGAMFGSPTGIFGADNAGGFYKIDINTGARFRISDSPASSTNDGAHCVTVPITFDSDLYVTKTDNTQFYTPGTTTIYTIVAGNNGIFGVQNAHVVDIVPAGIPSANMTYTAVASSGSITSVSGTMTGAINDYVSLAVGGTVTYTVTVNIPAGFTGNLVNTATISSPTESTDPNPSNNIATDTNVSICSTGVDSDGDGISDFCDLDDDNDGILDADEMMCLNINAIQPTPAGAIATFTETGIPSFTAIYKISTVESAAYTYIANIFGYSNITAIAAQTNTNNPINSVTFNRAVYSLDTALDDVDGSETATLRFYDEANNLIPGSVVQQYVTFIGNQISSVTYPAGQSIHVIGSSAASSTLESAVRITFPKSIGITKIEYEQLTQLSGGSNNGLVLMNGCVDIDTDGDGIWNRLDLDSDGDSCPDAIEGTGGFITANLLNSSMPGGNSGAGYTGTAGPITQNLGNTVSVNGIPIIAGTGQGIGSSKNATVNACNQGYIYITKKALDENSSVDFNFTVNGGSVAAFQLNDRETTTALNDLGSSADGRLWAVASNNTLYYRNQGSSEWLQTSVTTAVRVDGAAGNDCYFINTAGQVLRYDGATAPTVIGSPANFGSSNAVDVGSAWNMTPYIINANQTVWIYNGSGNVWTQVGTTNNNTTAIDADPSTGDAVVTDGSIVYRLTSAGVKISLGTPGFVDDIAVTSVGEIFASSAAAYVRKWNTGTSWYNNETSSRYLADRMTGGYKEQVWTTNTSYTQLNSVYTRVLSGTTASWLDDERLRTSNKGNSIMIKVPAGTYTVKETTTSGWELQSMDVYDPSSNSSSNFSDQSVTLNVTAGETVHAVFTNGSVIPFAMGSDCSIVFFEDFGSGAVGSFGGPLTGQTSYHYSDGSIDPTQDGYYTVVGDTTNFAWWSSPPTYDHTSNDGTGKMMAINASYDKGIFFRRKFTNLIPGKSYKFSAWLMSLSNDIIKPNATFQVIDPVSGNVLNEVPSGDITADHIWNEYSMNFVPTSTELDLILLNNAPGGNGNDIALDDIRFEMNRPQNLTASRNCAAATVTITSPLGAVYEYSLDNVSWQSTPTFTGVSPSITNFYVRYADIPGCVSSNTLPSCYCYKPGLMTGGAVLDTKVGITSLSRAGADNADNWPMVRKGGWIVLESKTKGFVPNRVAFSDADNNPATPDIPLGIPSTDFVEGMMVYDNTNHCMKIYTSTDNGVNYHWYCISTQTCPD